MAGFGCSPRIWTLPIHLNRIKAFCREEAEYLAARRFEDAARELDRCSSDQYAVVYRADKIESIQDIRAISQHLREELTHWQQNYFGVKGAEGHVIAEDVANHSLWPTIQQHLSQLGYKDSLPLLAAEAGAKLASGAHSDLGLNKDQALEFLSHYYLQIVKLHGVAAANQILQFVDRTQVLRLHAIGKTILTETQR